MEQESNTNLQVIITNLLFHDIKPNGLSFDEFLNLVSSTDSTIAWKEMKLELNPENEIKLCMFYINWNLIYPINSESIVTKYFNSLILDNKFNVLMYGGPKVHDSKRDKFLLNDIKKLIGDNSYNSYKAYEGTTINVYYSHHNDKWYFSTKRKFDMFESNFGSDSSHGQMFVEIVNIDQMIQKLDKKYSYQFVLSHKKNALLDIDKNNKLILCSVRDKNRGNQLLNRNEMTAIYELLSNLGNIELPQNYLLEEFEKNMDSNSQGIIIKFGEELFRVYTNTYIKLLKMNPKIYSVQSNLLWNYNNNTLTQYIYYNNWNVGNENKKAIYKTTCNVFNYVVSILDKLLNHFTEFKLGSEDNIKFKHKNCSDYERILKNYNVIKHHIYKLQRLPFAVKSITSMDKNQIKHHLKYYCDPNDIYRMYKIFTNDTDILSLEGCIFDIELNKYFSNLKIV